MEFVSHNLFMAVGDAKRWLIPCVSQLCNEVRDHGIAAFPGALIMVSCCEIYHECTCFLLSMSTSLSLPARYR